MRTCTKCGTDDPLRFYTHKRSSWCKQCHCDVVYRQRLKRVGMTPESLAALKLAQDNRCAICQRSGELFGRALHMDHNHATAQPRALLCGRCNQTLGKVHEDAGLLRAMADYIERWRVADKK